MPSTAQGRHKVRSFYNNIIDPESALYTTMDTHAVNATLLSLLGGSDLEVSQNFGSNVSKWTRVGSNMSPLTNGGKGVKGTYPLWGESYRRAAEEISQRDGGRLVLPREMQSVTWEGIRALISPEQKRDNSLRAVVSELKSKYYAEKLTANELREAIYEAVGGFDPIPWNE